MNSLTLDVKVGIFVYKEQNGKSLIVTHIEVNDSPRGHAIMLLADSGESIRG